MLPVTVGTILFPTLSGMSDDVRRWQFTKKVVGFVGLVMTSIAIAASFGSWPLIRTLYGQAFEPATPAFVWLLPGIVLLSLSSLLMNYLASVGMPPIVMYSSGTAAIANVGLNLKLIPSFGIQGASLSMTLSAAIMLAMVLFYIYRSKLTQPLSGRDAA
jgi:O-antigen/teichoic acid export membrane protein